MGLASNPDKPNPDFQPQPVLAGRPGVTEFFYLCVAVANFPTQKQKLVLPF